MQSDPSHDFFELRYYRASIFILASFVSLTVSQWIVFFKSGDIGYVHLLLTIILLALTISIHPKVSFLDFLAPERMLSYIKQNPYLPFFLNATFSLYLFLNNKLFLSLTIVNFTFYYLYSKTKKNYFIGLIVLLLIVTIVLKLDFTPHAVGSDILPIIKAANDNMLQGVHPYIADYSHISFNKYFYMPVQSLVYMPAHIFGFSYAWINFIFYLSCIIFSYFFFKKKGKAPYFNLTLLPIFFSYHMWKLLNTAQVLTYFLPVIIGLLLFSQNKYLLSALFLGIALSMRQTAIVFIGLLFLFFILSQDRNRVIKSLIVGIAPLILSLSIFEYLYPGTVRLIFIDLPNQQILRAVNSGNPKMFVGLSYWVQKLFSYGHNQAIQVFIGITSALMIAYLTMKNRISSFDVLVVTGCIYIVFMSINPYIHEYYYYPGHFLCATAMLCKVDEKAW